LSFNAGTVPAGRRDEISPSGSDSPRRRDRPITATESVLAPASYDERAIVDRVLAGDPEAFRALVEREGPSVVRACHRVLADLHEA
jgi:hypothetical protein